MDDRVNLNKNVVIPDTQKYNAFAVNPYPRFKDVGRFPLLAKNYKNKPRQENYLVMLVIPVLEYGRLGMPRRLPISPLDNPDEETPWDNPDSGGEQPDGDGLPPGQPRIIPPWQIPPGPATPNPDIPGGPPAASVKIYIP